MGGLAESGQKIYNMVEDNKNLRGNYKTRTSAFAA